jgi:hypothetical protein
MKMEKYNGMGDIEGMLYSTALLLPPSTNSPRSSTTAAARSSGKGKDGSAKSAMDGGL